MVNRGFPKPVPSDAIDTVVRAPNPLFNQHLRPHEPFLQFKKFSFILRKINSLCGIPNSSLEHHRERRNLRRSGIYLWHRSPGFLGKPSRFCFIRKHKQFVVRLIWNYQIFRKPIPVPHNHDAFIVCGQKHLRLQLLHLPDQTFNKFLFTGKWVRISETPRAISGHRTNVEPGCIGSPDIQSVRVKVPKNIITHPVPAVGHNHITFLKPHNHTRIAAQAQC